MDIEILIELVRARNCLYNLSHKKYNDYSFKESLWKEIGYGMNQPG
jgi:hypothetical protein